MSHTDYGSPTHAGQKRRGTSLDGSFHRPTMTSTKKVARSAESFCFLLQNELIRLKTEEQRRTTQNARRRPKETRWTRGVVACTAEESPERSEALPESAVPCRTWRDRLPYRLPRPKERLACVRPLKVDLGSVKSLVKQWWFGKDH